MATKEQKKRILLPESKIQVPAAPKNRISRKELIDRIEKGKEETVVFWAETGFGKTTVMAELARKHDGECGWYCLDERDNDPDYFLYGISSAMAAFFLSIQTEVFYLCLDEFQVISNERICRLIKALMEYGGGKIRMLIAVKGDFPSFLASDLMEEKVLIIGPNQLRFGAKETGQILKRMTGIGLQSQLVEDVQQYMCGWTAGIIFAGREIRNALPEIIELVQFDKSYLFDYIFHEIFHRLPNEIQIFLTESSVFGEMDSALCDYALERSDSEHMLDSIMRKKLFASRQKENRNLYCYDSFFADFLRSMGDADREEEILCRAAEYYARCKEWALSVSFGMRCRQSGRKKLPETTLFYMYRFCREQGAEEEGAVLLAAAIEKAAENRNYGAYAEYVCVFAADARERRDLARARELLAEAQKRLDSEAEDTSTGLQVRCLGMFEVTGPIGKAVWRTRKTGELFACLFFEEGRGMKKDILMERLWPELCSERASVLFHTTASYLRRALAQVGATDILHVDNQTYAVDISRIESDYGRLMDWNGYARKGLWPEGRDVLEVAELYRDCYMCGEDYAWLGGQREYVEQVFLQTVELLAGILMDAGEYTNAALLLEKGIQVDGYAFSLLQLLAECLILTGDLRRAKHRYSDMKRVFREELAEELELEWKDIVKKAEDRRKKQRC